MEATQSPSSGTSDYTAERLRWMVQLRWAALACAAVGAGLGAAGLLGAVAWKLMGAVAVAGAAFNLGLSYLERRDVRPFGERAPLVHALTDLVMLTLLLWAAGGLDCPFTTIYLFHVTLIAILGGPRWTRVAVFASCLGALFIALPAFRPEVQIAVWAPIAPLDVLMELADLGLTVIGIAYVVTHAVGQLRDRERAIASARDRAALEYQLLSNTLDELHAGLEVLDDEGRVVWRNKRAAELAPFVEVGQVWTCPGTDRPCERDASGICPVHHAADGEGGGRCRFAVPAEGGGEHVYEMLVFAVDEDRVMNLYVDRTEATLAEARLLLAERLASLGRVAQGVAHELNTPLATIRTLAADMRLALETIDGEVARDLDESASLIRDETRRLGKITQALLAGGDLVRARIDGHVPLAAAVERSRAIVFAGLREGPDVTVDDHIAEVQVATDMDRLVQVLVNLLQNAVDALRHQGGHISIRAHHEDGSVSLVVEDDGPGIPEEVRHRLFEPFATSKPPGEGTGLGLYTSYMLVREMGGELTLGEREGGGAKATIRLPASRALEASA
ncbi:MAG: hypothetical protein CMN30_07170 [Sandaracinus sp.]|nr:hypothetical protein [Sandaracinus sp.]|tara:strand:- start:2346 stop:4028 length:1683 start_codon:yes stop_codon:yes gene_type:complete